MNLTQNYRRCGYFFLHILLCHSSFLMIASVVNCSLEYAYFLCRRTSFPVVHERAFVHHGFSTRENSPLGVISGVQEELWPQISIQEILKYPSFYCLQAPQVGLKCRHSSIPFWKKPVGRCTTSCWTVRFRIATQRYGCRTCAVFRPRAGDLSHGGISRKGEVMALWNMVMRMQRVKKKRLRTTGIKLLPVLSGWHKTARGGDKDLMKGSTLISDSSLHVY